jgi:hypothetical protein
LILFGGSVLVLPQVAMAHSPGDAVEDATVHRVTEAPLYDSENGLQSMLIMSILFGGDSETRYRIFLYENSHKKGPIEVLKRAIDVVGGTVFVAPTNRYFKLSLTRYDRILFNAALRYTYPQCLDCIGENSFTNYVLYVVRGEYLPCLIELWSKYRDKLADVGGPECQSVVVRGLANVEWSSTSG